MVSLGVSQLLNIDDESYSVAAQGVAQEVSSYGVDVSPSDVETILRRYVSRGAGGVEQRDYGSDTGYGKDQTTRTISNDLDFDYTVVANVLNTLSTQAYYGLVDERIAYPRKWENEAESAAAQSAADTAVKNASRPGIIEKGIYDFSNALSTGILRGVEGAFPLLVIGGVVYYLLVVEPKTRSRYE